MLTLLRLGRRTSHTLHHINNCRLWLIHREWNDHAGWQQRGYKFGDYITHLSSNSMAQHQVQTDKWVYSGLYEGLVKTVYSYAKAGSRLQLGIGPFFKLTKEGQKEARKLK